MRSRAIALLLLSLLAACASGGKPSGEASYTDNAQALYQEGVEELDDENWMQAIPIFEQVRTRFPYSSFAALAELRLADAQFGQQKWAEAIDLYTNFVKLHPTHPQVDWAAFRIGESHYKAIPSDFFIFPPPSQRDVTEALAARTSLSEFIDRYPKSQYVDEAKERRREVLELLASHELYVGDFYKKRGFLQGAAGRYEYLLQTYPGVGLDDEATFNLVEAYRELGEPEKAKAALQRFLQRHPSGDGSDRARKILGELR